jgi:hypothetical protein
MAWFHFSDMHSGGGVKMAPFESIYVEAANEETAKRVFEDHTGRDPDNVTCECCGGDYWIMECEAPEPAPHRLIIAASVHAS